MHNTRSKSQAKKESNLYPDISCLTPSESDEEKNTVNNCEICGIKYVKTRLVSALCDQCLKKYSKSCDENSKTHQQRTKPPSDFTNKLPYTLKSTCETKASNNSNYGLFIILPCVIFLLAIYWMVWYNPDVPSRAIQVKMQMKALKRKYPAQNPEVWHNIGSIMNETEPSVNSLIFLYNGNPETSECLASEVASRISEIRNLKTTNVVFDFKHNHKDYGETLSMYYSKIDVSGSLIVNELNKMPGRTARIFHTLCDDITPQAKPATFIFTLPYEKSLANLRPIRRASTILKKVWSDLPEHELHPLLSRIVTNVVEVLPEDLLSC